MQKLITGALTALTLATTLSVGATAAQADDWHGRGYYRGGGYYHGRGPGVGAVVGAGILGLAVGAGGNVANHVDRGGLHRRRASAEEPRDHRQGVHVKDGLHAIVRPVV